MNIRHEATPFVDLPAADVDVLAKPGDRARAGESIIARIRSIRAENLR